MSWQEIFGLRGIATPLPELSGQSETKGGEQLPVPVRQNSLFRGFGELFQPLSGGKGNQDASSNRNSGEGSILGDAVKRAVQDLGIPLATAIVAENLFRPGKEGISRADRLQKKLVDAVQAMISEAGESVQVALPTEANILREVDYIRGVFRRCVPPPLRQACRGKDPKEVYYDNIDSRAINFTRALFTASRNQNYPPTEEELNLARILSIRGDFTDEDELRKLVYSHVYQRAQDIATDELNAQLATHYRSLARRRASLESTQERVVFVTDIGTLKVMVEESAREAMKSTVWGLSPAGITVRSVTGRQDVVLIKWTEFRGIGKPQRGKDGVYLVIDYPRFVDQLNAVLWGLLRPLTERRAGSLGGIIRFLTSERDRPLAQIAVRNPQLIAEKLIGLASLVQSFWQAYALMERVTAEQDPNKRLPIRPDVVWALVDRIVSSSRTTFALPEKTEGGNRKDGIISPKEEDGQIDRKIEMTPETARRFLDMAYGGERGKRLLWKSALSDTNGDPEKARKLLLQRIEEAEKILS